MSGIHFGTVLPGFYSPLIRCPAYLYWIWTECDEFNSFYIKCFPKRQRIFFFVKLSFSVLHLNVFMGLSRLKTKPKHLSSVQRNESPLKTHWVTVLWPVRPNQWTQSGPSRTPSLGTTADQFQSLDVVIVASIVLKFLFDSRLKLVTSRRSASGLTFPGLNFPPESRKSISGSTLCFIPSDSSSSFSSSSSFFFFFSLLCRHRRSDIMATTGERRQVFVVAAGSGQERPETERESLNVEVRSVRSCRDRTGSGRRRSVGSEGGEEMWRPGRGNSRWRSDRSDEGGHTCSPMIHRAARRLFPAAARVSFQKKQKEFDPSCRTL